MNCEKESSRKIQSAEGTLKRSKEELRSGGSDIVPKQLSGLAASQIHYSAMPILQNQPAVDYSIHLSDCCHLTFVPF
jgi:hypothetical protein